MFLFLRCFAALIVVVPCLNTLNWDDYDALTTLAFTCPNEECNDSTYLQSPYRLNYYPISVSRALACCRLSGLREGNAIQRKYEYRNYDQPKQRLRRLIIENSTVESIPKNVMTEFEPSVFHMINGSLKTLSIADFAGATHLTEFNATRNQIAKLDPNIFIFAANIESIDLSNNRIMEVSEFAFENVPKLEVLILSDNLIVKLEFKSKPVNLRVFMVSNNSLSHLNENLFDQSVRLADLSLNNNKFNMSQLNVAGHLDFFDLSNNPTSFYLSSKNLNLKNSNVKVLNISEISVTIDATDNQISSILVHPENVLTELILCRNNLTTMKNLTALKSMEKLDLSFNQITDINLTSFSQMSQLKWLNLENSGLKTIDFGLFSQQKSLGWLDISYNNLKVVNLNMLTDSIDHLFIEGNSLTNIDLNDLAMTLPKLQLLGLANNKFTCEKLIEIRKVLKFHLVELHVDEEVMVKFSRNINGMGCVNENSTETIELDSAKLLPIHTSNSDQFIDSIHRKIQEIETNIRVQSESLNENSVNSKDDILAMKQELMNIRNDGELQIIDAKADILMSISRLFNVSTNGTSVSIDLQATVEELNKINLERYQSLSSELKVVKDKLQNLEQSITNLRGAEMGSGKNVSPLKRINGEDSSATSSSDLNSLRNMMTFIVVTVVGLIFGFSSFLVYKRFYQNRRRRQYVSTNTINTNVEQSLV